MAEKVSRDRGYRSDTIAISRDVGPLRRLLTLVLLQKHCNTNGSRIVIQIGVYTTFREEEGMLLQKYRDSNGRCIAIPSEASGSGVELILLILLMSVTSPVCHPLFLSQVGLNLQT